MAESKPTETKTEATPPKPRKTAARRAPRQTKQSEGVTLYRADGREKTVTDPAVQAQLEFSGWSANKSVFKAKK